MQGFLFARASPVHHDSSMITSAWAGSESFAPRANGLVERPERAAVRAEGPL
jgi:hypothetical protein